MTKNAFKVLPFLFSIIIILVYKLLCVSSNRKKNTDLKTLILCHNSFEDDGAKQLRDALLENDTLITLDLSWNHFQCKGCCYIAEGMAVTRTISIISTNFSKQYIYKQKAT